MLEVVLASRVSDVYLHGIVELGHGVSMASDHVKAGRSRSRPNTVQVWLAISPACVDGSIGNGGDIVRVVAQQMAGDAV